MKIFPKKDKGYRHNDLQAKLRPFRDGKIPSGYNEKMHWLMVHDQMPEHVICSDKFLCRSFVANRIGEKYLREIYDVSRSVDNINFHRLPETFVIKANHDSGSVFVVDNERMWKSVKRKLSRRLKNIYGWEKGEWAYSYILPRVFVEEFMPGPIVDYKFHCCDGEICWTQVIYERSSGHPREVNVCEDFVSLGIHFDDQFILDDTAPDKPVSWDEMKELARILSKGFRYVRVDFYEYLEKPSFGELTFWPRAGNYDSEGEQKLGALLNFDTSFSRPTIHDFFASQKHGFGQ